MKPIIYLFLSIMILSLSRELAQGMAQVKQNEDNVDTIMKYQGMDQNNDGKITRVEWQVYFDNRDWNGDGVLSGDELRLAASQYQGTSAFSDQFRALDRNNSGAISRSEWTGTMQDFNRLDQDRNGNLSVNEFYQRPGSDQFSELDYNNDGVITYDEWSPNSRRSLEALDLNRDGKLNRDEFYNQQQYPISVFRELDQNNDGMISRSEWRSTSEAFNRLDTNGDNLLSENEFNTPQSNSIAVQILQEIFKKR
jgi:Ca2+-binding EF-hand superfamily protein